MRQYNYHNIQTPSGPLPQGTTIALNVYTDDVIAARHFGGGGLFSDGVLIVRLEDCAPATAALNIWFQASGYAPVFWREPMPAIGQQEGSFAIPELVPSVLPFPPASKRPALPPPEASDAFGQVYSELPPEWYTQAGTRPIARSLDLIRGNAFTHVTPFAPQDINPMCTFAWLQSIGQNTNYDMTCWFTPLLPLYPPDVVDAFLADYSMWWTHHLTSAYGTSVDQVAALSAKVRATGMYAFHASVSIPEIQALASMKAVDGIVCGLQLNGLPPDQADAVVRAAAAACVPQGIRVWVHFYGTGGPTDAQQWGIYDYIPWWAEMAQLGVTGLMHQTYMTYDPDPSYRPAQGADASLCGDSAGKMGAMSFYPRVGLYQANPTLLFCHCEDWSAPVFNGNTNPLFAARRAREMVCCPNGGQANPVAGSLSGPTDWDGSIF